MNENKPENAAQPPTQLAWPDFVRKRPGMYFGGIDSAALHQIVWTVIDHAVDETLGNKGRHIEVVLQDTNVVSISDSGAGLPVDVDPETGRPKLELFLIGEFGRKLDSTHHGPHVSLSDWDLSWVNAVSVEFSVQIRRGLFLWEQHYKQGQPQAPLHKVRALQSGEMSGTTITFSPDFSIFDTCDFDYKLLARRCRELAFLLSGVTIDLIDQRPTYQHRYDKFSSGLKHYLNLLNRDYHVLHDPIVYRKTVELRRDREPSTYTVDIEIGLQYTETHQPMLLGFVNTFEVEQGGTHIRGLTEALDRVISDYASKTGVGGYYTFIEDDIVCGLSAVLNIWHPAPEFMGSMRYELKNPELEDATYWIVREAVEAFSTAHPDQMQRIVDKCAQNKASRMHRRYGA